MADKNENIPDCCAPKDNLKQGIIYGLLPHAGCIAFMAGTILGVTVLTQLFRPLLMNAYFFYALIALSLILTTVSAVFYLRKFSLLSAKGIKSKWKYLTTMYGTTVAVNLLMFFFVFPLLANVSTATAGTASLAPLGGAVSTLNLQVDIPCSGHASLISGDLKALSGVQSVTFSLPNKFAVTYDPSKTSEGKILALDVFQEYKATVLSN